MNGLGGVDAMPRREPLPPVKRYILRRTYLHETAAQRAALARPVVPERKQTGWNLFVLALLGFS